MPVDQQLRAQTLSEGTSSAMAALGLRSALTGIHSASTLPWVPVAPAVDIPNRPAHFVVTLPAETKASEWRIELGDATAVVDLAKTKSAAASPAQTIEVNVSRWSGRHVTVMLFSQNACGSASCDSGKHVWIEPRLLLL